jgi:type III pantothenate kinase
MLLAVDIGNTTIGFAVINKAGHILSVTIIDTDAHANKIKAVVVKILKAHAISRAIICSVVPKASKTMEDILSSYHVIPAKAGIHKKILPISIIGRDLKVPIKNCYKNPNQVGQDRLVGAYGAMKIYGCPLIVVDLGTAITFDVISTKGEYLGGAIVPGIRLSAESLFLKTALLPRIEIQAPRRIIGKTTQESILSGLFYGYGSLCKGMIDLLSVSLRKTSKASDEGPHAGHSQELAISVKVVMTGGHTRLMKKYIFSKFRDKPSNRHSRESHRQGGAGGNPIIDEDIVFKGIYFLSQL